MEHAMVTASPAAKECSPVFVLVNPEVNPMFVPVDPVLMSLDPVFIPLPGFPSEMFGCWEEYVSALRLKIVEVLSVENR